VGSGQISYIPWPENYINVETGDYISDISKLKNQLNWKPRINVIDGLLKTYEYYKNNHQKYWQYVSV
jgi:nucleoside-diphosphate-sugar epimerase